MGTTIYNGVNYAAYAGPLSLSTVEETAGFSSGSQTGFVMQIVVPEPGARPLLLVGSVIAFLATRHRRTRRTRRS